MEEPVTVLQFPRIAWCPDCDERMRVDDLHAHRHDCPVRAARMAHPSNHKRRPDDGGAA